MKHEAYRVSRTIEFCIAQSLCSTLVPSTTSVHRAQTSTLGTAQFIVMRRLALFLCRKAGHLHDLARRCAENTALQSSETNRRQSSGNFGDLVAQTRTAPRQSRHAKVDKA